MGTVIAGECWLVDQASFLEAARPTLLRIAHMQILMASKQGHLVFLGTEYLRRHITKAALVGEIADVTVPCMGCCVEAKLRFWLAAATQSEEDAAFIVAGHLLDGRPYDHRILLLCRPNKPSAQALRRISELWEGTV